MVNGNINLTKGNIYKGLISLSLPIMLTSFIQTSYNLMDLFWLGKLSTDAVAAAGTVGFFTWLANSIVIVPRIGAEVGVAESIGANKKDLVKKFINNSMQLTIIIGIIYAFILLIFKEQLIGFYNLNNEIVEGMSVDYLTIIASGMIFTFINPVMSGIYNGWGRSKTPFIINTIGLVANIVLDPIFIFGFYNIPAMGIKGAGYATVFAQFIVTLLFFIVGKRQLKINKNFKVIEKIDKICMKRIISIGFPAALQACTFAIISMVAARIIANWGKEAIAAQKIANQIESITWMTVGGFSTALSAFIAQNRGAKNNSRIIEGYHKGIKIVIGIGFATFSLLFFAAEPLFKIFIADDPVTISIGIQYLKILALSEVLMSLEVGITGVFNGFELTKVPAITGIILNAIRIPLFLIVKNMGFDLKYVWWIISITAMLKGLILLILVKKPLNNLKKEEYLDY